MNGALNRMFNYLPSESFKNKVIIETNNRWLDSSLLNVLNESSHFVLTNYTHLNFSSQLKTQLDQTALLKLENPEEKKKIIWVDNVFSENFVSIFGHFATVLHEGMYNNSNLLNRIQKLLANQETSRYFFYDDEDFTLDKSTGEEYAAINLRDQIQDIVQDITEEHSDKEYYLTRKLQLTRVLEKHIFPIVIDLTKLSFSSDRKDFSVCLQELLLLVNDLLALPHFLI